MLVEQHLKTLQTDCASLGKSNHTNRFLPLPQLSFCTPPIANLEDISSFLHLSALLTVTLDVRACDIAEKNGPEYSPAVPTLMT
jgi:hypothetical protein